MRIVIDTSVLIGNLRIGTPEQLGRALCGTIDEEAQGLAETGAIYSAKITQLDEIINETAAKSS